MSGEKSLLTFLSNPYRYLLSLTIGVIYMRIMVCMFDQHKTSKRGIQIKNWGALSHKKFGVIRVICTEFGPRKWYCFVLNRGYFVMAMLLH